MARLGAQYVSTGIGNEAGVMVPAPVEEVATEPEVRKLETAHRATNMKDRKPLETREDTDGTKWDVMAEYRAPDAGADVSSRAAVMRNDKGEYVVGRDNGDVVLLDEFGSKPTIVDLGNEHTFGVAYDKLRDELRVDPFVEGVGKSGGEIIETFAMFSPIESQE